MLYWFLMILSLLGSGYLGYRPDGRWFGGWAFLAWVLFFLIGLKLFGSPIR